MRLPVKEALVSAGIGALLALGRIVTPASAVGIGLLVFAAWYALRQGEQRLTGWPAAPRPDRLGGRRDVAELSWMALSRDGRVTEKVMTRIRGIAARRLALHGVLWTGLLPHHLDLGRLDGWGSGPADAAEHLARAETLLGPAMVAGLRSRTPISARTLDQWCRSLDRLVVDQTQRMEM
ncbi:MAG: hypothetical protein FWG11_05610 [Promicromonosporaceae bacterium]|nr:hypothetical protein [Promicromonosporaceae bacterium]